MDLGCCPQRPSADVARLLPTAAQPAASFAGTWRVIGVTAAPWVKAHPLGKREAPLLEYALIFADGEIEGPSPLGCRHAKFATTVSSSRTTALDLHDQMSGEPEPDRSAVASVVADRSNWLFTKDAATVHFTVYAVASFAAGEFGVEIPYEKLRPYLRPDSPIP